MQRQPNGIKYKELLRVLNEYGYKLVRSKGSHRHFRNGEGDLITIKEENPLKAVYIKDLLGRIGSKDFPNPRDLK
ncbi:MAG: type II toxin-antitoxin system HicA family toxin [Tissierellaceae bacterium]